VKDDFFSLQALAKNLMLFHKGLHFVSRLCIYTAIDLYEVYFPIAEI